MEVVQGVPDIRMPYIPHKVREHGVHILPILQPVVHVSIDKMMLAVIRVDTYARIFLLWKSGIPETLETSFQPAGTVWMIIPVWKKGHAVRKQAADSPVIISQISCKLLRDMDSPTLRSFELNDIKITLAQMYVSMGKCAWLFAAEPTAV